MVIVNHEEIRDVFAFVGKELLANYSHREAPADREEMFERFTAANEWAEEEIKKFLLDRYPAVHWSDAELVFEKQKTPEFRGAYWVLDPVDGGMHLHQGCAFWGMSLCLVENGQPSYALVYDAYRDECFHAFHGQGAFLNGEPTQIARKTRVHDSLLVTAPPAVIVEDPVNTELTIWSIGKLLPEAFAVRLLGSVALQLAYVACGRMDAYWEYGEQLYDWMAGALIVKEAKGSVTDIRGQEFTWGSIGIIAGNEPLRQEIQTLLMR
ncbi:inositol monophosphatase family protein [Paenibacillus tuaregi]|uniref:inositol monophosphatase family protein n=1 Tax=Paenibacillus tuaregi TaxID=1816681 RepID=UPI000837E415|nr:inositol monophosphatase family protein [Paenibacillus tuaregi]